MHVSHHTRHCCMGACLCVRGFLGLVEHSMQYSEGLTSCAERALIHAQDLELIRAFRGLKIKDQAVTIDVEYKVTLLPMSGRHSKEARCHNVVCQCRYGAFRQSPPGQRSR